MSSFFHPFPIVRVFVYEYTCGPASSLRDDIRSLRAQGAAMLHAIGSDLARVEGVSVTTVLAEDTPFDAPWATVTRARPADEEKSFRACMRSADECLLIAPEFDEILATRSAWARDAGVSLLNPEAPAIRLASDKLTLAGHLRGRGIPTPPTWRMEPGWSAAPDEFPAVRKPRFGAGSLGVRLAASGSDVAHETAGSPHEASIGETILQRWVPGQPASVLLLTGPGLRLSLEPTVQALSTDGRFEYLGGSLPLQPSLARRATALAERTVAELPPTRGPVGVDLVLGGPADGSEDWVIEVNPRLTTSYLGLRSLARTNLAWAMLEAARGRQVTIEWQCAALDFRVDGTIGRRDLNAKGSVFS